VGRNLSSSTKRYDALLQLLRTADAVWAASRVFFERWELSPSQFNVLNLLDSNPEGLSQSDLGRQLITHRSNITGLVDRLEKRRLVKREETAADRRAYRVVLTNDGSKLLKDILPHYYEKAEQVWDGVSNERIAELLTATDQVARNAADVLRTRAGKSAAEEPS
jgi:DNA-binding MarR family transcriptional regulator